MRTIHADLMCDGCGRFTPHTFDDLKEPPKGPGPAPVGPVYLNLMYVCDICEAERVFGRLSPTDRSHLARILRKLRE